MSYKYTSNSITLGNKEISATEVNVGVEGDYQKKEVTPSTSNIKVTPDNEYDALSEVTVKAVTASIDANIVADNIKKGVTILGVTGTYEG